MTDAIRELFELLTKKEKSGSDYTGTVTRVDGKTAYVQFDGSDITDTPVALSIGAKAGDSVRVRVADGRAWLVGNDDAPPNDSSEVGYELALTNALIRQLTTEQINGENGWINLLLGTFNYGNKLIWNGRELTLNGKVVTTAGTIGGWTISGDQIYKAIITGGYEYRAILNAPANISANTVAFAIAVRTNNGSGSTGQWSYPFTVTYGGLLASSDANVKGNIEANTGKFGIFEIDGVTIKAVDSTSGHKILITTYDDDYATPTVTVLNGASASVYAKLRDAGLSVVNGANGSTYGATGCTVDGELMANGPIYEGAGTAGSAVALSSKYAPLSATQMVPVTPTVGNGSIMALSNNTTHKKLNQVFINCAVTFSGSRASGSLLLRLPMALQRTQYVTINKNGSASYMSSFAAGGNGVADCNCPVAFASGDIAYITGVVTLD